MLLLQREDYRNGIKENVYEYEYHNESSGPRRKRLSKFHNPRFPILRRCIDGSSGFEELNYNYRGFGSKRILYSAWQFDSLQLPLSQWQQLRGRTSAG
jgi:hypothetical protein